MSLKYAILGLLSYKPQTGYQIKANFDQSIRYLWNSDQSQIYRTLTEITKEGLAVSETILQEGRPNKKVYDITEKGIEDLKIWLSASVQSYQRNAELLQIFFSGQLSDPEILENMIRVRKNIEMQIIGLTSLESSSELFKLENKTKREKFFFRATLDLGLRSAKISLKWISEIIKKLENAEVPKI